MKRALFGAGGFAIDIMGILGDMKMMCFVDDEYYAGAPRTKPISGFDPEEYELAVTVADPAHRQRIVSSLPKETKYLSIIHPSTRLLGPVKIGAGCIINAGCLIAAGAEIGKQCHLNLMTIIGHTTRVGDFFTSAPQVGIMGDNRIGNRVYFGRGAGTKQKILICDDVTVGMGANVTRDIDHPGVYIGTPARRQL